MIETKKSIRNLRLKVGKVLKFNIGRSQFGGHQALWRQLLTFILEIRKIGFALYRFSGVTVIAIALLLFLYWGGIKVHLAVYHFIDARLIILVYGIV